MSMMASQITSLTIVCSTVYSGAYQRKHQSSASQDFVRGIHRWPVNSSHQGPVTRKIFPFNDVIMWHSPRGGRLNFRSRHRHIMHVILCDKVWDGKQTCYRWKYLVCTFCPLLNLYAHITGILPLYCNFVRCTRIRTAAPRAHCDIKTLFTGMGISMLKIKRSPDHLIFNTGVPILV